MMKILHMVDCSGSQADTQGATQSIQRMNKHDGRLPRLGNRQRSSEAGLGCREEIHGSSSRHAGTPD